LRSDEFGQPRRNASGRIEDDISALDISPHVFASRLDKHLDQIFHCDLVLATEINPSKQRKVSGWHIIQNTPCIPFEVMLLFQHTAVFAA
jgi:hypothetical protein